MGDDMTKAKAALRGVVCASLVAAGTFAAIDQAEAGGFAIREQSASYLGSAFAGSATGGDLSSMFWNPAAVTVKQGINFEGHAALIIPDSDLTATGGTLFGTGSGRGSGEIGNDAIVPSNYVNYQLSQIDPNLYVGLAVSAPFGLVTEPENDTWDGAQIGRTAKVHTTNVNPIVGYQVMPGLSVAAGLQINYIDATLKFASGSPFGANTFFRGEDYGLGWNLGAIAEPFEGTRIGVGYRSEINHDIEGKLGDNVPPIALPSPPFPPGAFFPTGARFSSSVDLDLPAIVTASISQAVSPNLRLLGTFEWTQWSKFDQLNVVPGTTENNGLAAIAALTPPGGPTPFVEGQTFLTIVADWDDAWFASGGAEYDYSDRLTVRGGVAYEESPIQKAVQRLTVVPDTNRIWLSGGATYKLNEMIEMDLAYTHIFYEDGTFNRETAIDPELNLFGDVETSVDIIAMSAKIKLGDDPQPVPFK